MPRRWILVSLIAACTIDEPGVQLAANEQAIVGGEQAADGQWPDAVAVLGTSGTCTGTLIAPNVVLTAGHCEGIKPVQVIANTVDYAEDGGVRAHVAKTIAYPNWQSSYDVAVLVLASPIAGVAPRKIGTSCTF